MFRLSALVTRCPQLMQQSFCWTATTAPLAARLSITWTGGTGTADWRGPQAPPAGLLVRAMSKTAKKKRGGKMADTKNTVDAIIETMDVEEGEDEESEQAVLPRDTPLRRLLDSKHHGGGGGGQQAKKGGGGAHRLQYTELNRIVDGELVWRELEQEISQLKEYYIHQLSIRSSTSLDDLAIDFEGDSYPLNELAAISKKDPKRIIIDVSSFPQASANIMAAIRDSGLNLNPQQDGLRIAVPIPKVTKEHREHLMEGARKRLTQTKQDLRKIQNKFQKIVGEKELSGQVTKDDAKAAAETIKYIQDHFAALADAALSTKLKELSGK